MNNIREVINIDITSLSREIREQLVTMIRATYDVTDFLEKTIDIYRNYRDEEARAGQLSNLFLNRKLYHSDTATADFKQDAETLIECFHLFTTYFDVIKSKKGSDQDSVLAMLNRKNKVVVMETEIIVIVQDE